MKYCLPLKNLINIFSHCLLFEKRINIYNPREVPIYGASQNYKKRLAL